MINHQRIGKIFLSISVLLILSVTPALSQGFDSGSDGTDGELDISTPGTYVFDPTTFTPPLDPDGDGIYHFTTITIGTGVTVRLGADVLGNKPVIWLATGDVVIDGTLDLNGEIGHPSSGPPIQSIAGAGGYNGGIGATPSTAAIPGEGPGGGTGEFSSNGAGHANNASGATNSYGNVFLQPLLGGSGGGGGTQSLGAGGGAGGGALLIASSTAISINGQIQANGGDEGICNCGTTTTRRGGGGSGGSIRLMAPLISGSGSLSVNYGNYRASVGRVRVEAFQHGFTGQVTGNVRYVTPGLVFPPASSPSVQVTSVGGIAVPANPLGSFNPADVVINENGSVAIELEASNIPLGTIVDLTFWSESTGSLTAQSSPLAGTIESSTATASVTFPHGFTRMSIQANWTP